METNVDTSHPRTCSQLTHCLIKVIYWFIYKRLKVAVKCVHTALILPSAALLYFHLEFNANNLLNIPPLPSSLCLTAADRCPPPPVWISIFC